MTGMGDSLSHMEVPVVATLAVESPANETPASVVDMRKTLDLARSGSDFTTVRQVVRLIPGDSYRVGRAKDNELVILSPDISRHHAVFSASRSGLVLSDLSSLNGTYLNGQRISTPVDLKSGDRVLVGRTTITATMHSGPHLGEGVVESQQTQTAPMAPIVMTLLVADIKGFTKLSHQLPAVDVTTMLDLWCGEVTDIIHRNQGIVDKFIGDCVMAFWIEEAQGGAEGAIKAILAASQIIEATKSLGASGKWFYNNTHPWRCRAVLNTGEALLGAVGTKGVRDFTVLGDAVNVTFKLERIASSKEVEILFSGETAERVGKHLAVRPLGIVTIEGRSDKVSIFTLA